MSVKIDLGAVTAYAIAVENGFVGTIAEWLESLKGEKGDTGAQGIQGEKGDTPVKGEDYFTEEEKDEMVQAVLDKAPQLPEWTGGEY